MRAGSSGLGRLGLGLVALCLVEAVDQRLDDKLDRQFVDIFYILRVSVLQRTFHRIQKRFLDFLETERSITYENILLLMCIQNNFNYSS